MLNPQKNSSQIFGALERSENCGLINWVINNGSINTLLHPVALLMLLDKQLGGYLYKLRLKMSKKICTYWPISIQTPKGLFGCHISEL